MQITRACCSDQGAKKGCHVMDVKYRGINLGNMRYNVIAATFMLLVPMQATLAAFKPIGIFKEHDSGGTGAGVYAIGANEVLLSIEEARIYRRAKNGDAVAVSKMVPAARYTFEIQVGEQKLTVAYDYHNMSKAAFSAKYKTTKKRFAKRYVKTKGDTYSLGKKKAAIALAIIATEPPRKVAGVTVTGKQAVMRSLAYDGASVIIGTNLGYDNAEKKYYDKK